MSDDHPSLARLKAEISRYANSVERLRDLVVALRLASAVEFEGNGAGLYWPYLLEVVEAMIPSDGELDRAVAAFSSG